MTIDDHRRLLAARMTARASKYGGRVEYLPDTGWWLLDWPMPGSPQSSGRGAVYLGRHHPAATARLAHHLAEARRHDPERRAARQRRAAAVWSVVSRILPAVLAAVRGAIGRR